MSPPDKSVSSVVAAAATRLAAAGIERPAAEARLLLAHAAGCEVGDLIRDPGRSVAAPDFAGLLERRAAHEPMAYLMGHAGFWTLRLAVGQATLIPRADSETLIEAALAALPDRAAPLRVLDLGTGTGCLLLAALAEYPAAFGVGVDLEPAACVLAAGNAAANGLAGRAAFLCGDWAAALAGDFDLVLCNPPYVPAAEIGALMPEVARFEPALALAGGEDGLDAYRSLVRLLPGLLAPVGIAICEVGAGQAAAVTALAQAHGFTAEWRRDLAGHLRAGLLRRAPG